MTPIKQYARILSVVVFTALLIIALWLSVTRQPADTLPDMDTPEVATEEPPPHAVERGGRRAQLVPLDSSRITAPASGVLAALSVARHEAVTAGQLIASLGTSDQNTRLSQAQTQAGVARHQVRTLRHLVADGYEPQANLDRAQARLDAALAQIADVQAEMEAGRILAPAAGVVQELLVEEGAEVEAGDLIAVIAPPGPRVARAQVPTNALEGIGVGHSARVIVGGQSVSVRIARVSLQGTNAELTLEFPEEADVPELGGTGQLFLHP